VVLPWVGRWFFTSVIEGATQVFADCGYDLLIYDVGGTGTKRRALDTRMLSKRVDGLMILSLPLRPSEVAELSTFKRPIVMIGPPLPGHTCVRIDDVNVGHQATDHLLSLGHRRIGFIGGSQGDTYGFPVAADRQRGYSRALNESGVAPDSELTLPAPFTVHGGKVAAELLLTRHRPPTAVVCASDEIAMGVIYAARHRGMRVPEDLSVVGVDNHDLAELFDLTTISQPVRDQGRIGARLVLSHLQSASEAKSGSAAGSPGTSEAERITMPTSLIVRNTTAPPSDRADHAIQ
jgi:DNA-binding LacI/PurR family transcriptional regulator